MSHLVLVLNCGSSSIKFHVYEGEQSILVGMIENVGQGEANLSYKIGQEKIQKNLGTINYQAAFQPIFSILQSHFTQSLTAIGHRVVHGGQLFTQPAIIDEKVFKQIQACSVLAPLHNPANILGIEAVRKVFPSLPQIAVFDTAFHQTLPDYAYLYALPYEYYQKHHVRRYGFHGISYQYLIPKAAELLNIPLAKSAFVAAHLGNGCSICAALGGKSVDVSMGFTPLEGLMMGTRSGNIDPGLFEYLTKILSCSVQKLTNILNSQSGLLGISGLSNDMRSLIEAAEQGHSHAQLAIEMFCYQLAKYIAAFMVPLGRIDALIFSGGIGENATLIREKTLPWLKFLGFEVDPEENKYHGENQSGIITTQASACAMVVKTQEEWMIAKEVLSYLIRL